MDAKEGQRNLLEEVKDHQSSSESFLSTAREQWPDYESIVISEHRESMQNDSRVFDPRLTTIELERTARVAAQYPSGKAFAVSKNDEGKNMVMNLLLPYQMKNAREQRSFLIKQMMASFWSRVYGTVFSLVPWRITDSYIGPELLLLSPWHSYPQPNVSINDADWFISYNRLSIKWLLKQDPTVWNMGEIKLLANEMKTAKDAGDVKVKDNTKSYIDQQLYPSEHGDVAYPYVETFTEYRKDKWITWAKRVNQTKGREYLLRVVDNSQGQVYPEHMLPVVAKDSIPMMNGKLGLGSFQRGKSLQFATNSLINLYFSGLRSAVYPERMINPDNVVMSSLKYGPSEQWFMNNPGQDVQIVQRGADAANTFNGAYGTLISAMLNQSGTTDTSNSSQVESSLGKTPAALKFQAMAMSSQDFLEQTMLEDMIEETMRRWVALNVRFLDDAQAVRIFGDDIQKIQEMYPDAVNMFSEKSATLNVDKSILNDGDTITDFDYTIETGSTAKTDINREVSDLMDLLNFVGDRPQILDLMNGQTGETVNVSELMKQIAMKKGAKDIDKIIIKTPQQETQMQPQQPPQGMEAPQEQQYQDPNINEIANQLLGGTNGMPQS